MKIIGITGPSGAGKSSASSIFASLGFHVADADSIYHSLLLPPSQCLDELIAAFGNTILNPDGSLNRSVLSSLVFGTDIASATRRTLLNSITHKYVIAEILKSADDCRKRGDVLFFADVPLLFESGFDSYCDLVISVIAGMSSRTSRIIGRDSISRVDAEARFASQHSDSFYTERSDYIIYNDGTESDLKARVREVATAILETENDCADTAKKE